MKSDTQADRAEFMAGLRDIAPLALGVAVYGLAFGLLAVQAGMNGLQTGIMGTLVFAGSSQIVMVERIVSGAGAFAAVLAGIALNLRLLLMTASLREELANRPFWQVALGVHLASDENWALLHAARNSGKRVGYWYLVGGGLCLLVTWVVATTAGASLAAVLPAPRALGMDFAFTAAFIAIMRGLWRGARTDLLPWAVSGGVAALMLLATPLDPSWGMVIAAIAGALVAGLRGHG
ncbi:MAG: AzlC family ABC transporter permease [Albidovulum sp.]